MLLEIKLIKKVNLEGHTLVAAFPGVGLVSTLATGHMVDERKMEYVGFLEIEGITNYVGIYEGKPLPSIRIYHDPKEKLCVLLSEQSIPINYSEVLANKIVEFCQKNKIKEVLLLSGMSSEGDRIFGVATNEELKKELKKINVDIISEGIITGFVGVLLLKLSLANLKALNLIIESHSEYPADPRGAAKLLKKAGEYLGIQFNIKALEQAEAEIEQKIKMLQKMKVRKEPKEELIPSMYG
ncbi:MAG: PAC2 family protein [archaeon]